jgi:hypothetical protein
VSEEIEDRIAQARGRLLKAGHVRTESDLSDEDIRIILGAIPAAVGVDAWVGMSDRKPPSGIHLFYRPAITIGGCQYGANIGTAFYYKDEEGEHYTADYHGPSSPTHWQPLPAEPLAGKVAAHE